MKTLDMRKSVSALVDEYPEVRSIMKELGFDQITSPVALKFMGKTMTIPKGAAVKGIPMDKITKAFEDHGFTITGLAEEARNTQEDLGQAARLKTFLQRLANGEDLEKVRADFAAEFSSVSVHDIVRAEQDLIHEGTSATEVQKLCDLHSALFHGRTEAEVWKEEEKELAAKKNAAATNDDPDIRKRNTAASNNNSDDKNKNTVASNADSDAGEKAEKGTEPEEGHPVTTLKLENTALLKILDKTDADVRAEDGYAVREDLQKLRKIKTLYSRKEQLIMPLLSQMGITGPSDVMWGVDDEIKQSVSSLSEKVTSDNLPEMAEDVTALTKRMREMIYKEENILFPMALEKFTQEQWALIYQDFPEMGTSFVDAYPIWPRGEEILKKHKEEQNKKEEKILSEGVLHFGEAEGTLTLAQLKALLELLPIDITFIDENDINRFFTNKGRVFSRPASALNRPVYLCHPAAIRPIVKKLLDDFKAGRKDSMEVWTPNKETPTRVRYVAVRDADGRYLGCVELVERFPKDMGKHFAK